VGILSNLLPGLRDLRPPLAAGFLWLTALGLFFSGSVGSSALPSEVDSKVRQLYSVANSLGQLAVLGFAAYLLGVISTTYTTRIGRAHAGREALRPWVDERAKRLTSDETEAILAHWAMREDAVLLRQRFDFLEPVGVTDIGLAGLGRSDVERLMASTYGTPQGDVIDRFRSEAEFRWGVTPALFAVAFAFALLLLENSAWVLATVAALSSVLVLLLWRAGSDAERQALELLGHSLGNAPDPPMPVSFEASLRETLSPERLAAGAFWHGALLERSNQPDEAESCYRRAATGGSVEGEIRLARLLEQKLLMRRGSADEAIDALKVAFEHGDRRSGYYLALILEQQGQTSEAMDAYEAVLKRKSTISAYESSWQKLSALPISESRRREHHSHAAFYVANAGFRYGALLEARDRPEQAADAYEYCLDVLQKASEPGPPSAQSWSAVGDVYPGVLRTGDVYPGVLVRLGALAERRDPPAPDVAEQLYERAIDAGSQDSLCAYRLGLLRERRGELLNANTR
jgi:tetratricopeptide (TPR) repeat protein